MPDYSLNMSIDLTWFKCNMLYSRWAAKNGMGYPEMMVLYGLYAFKCSSQKEIAEHFHVRRFGNPLSSMIWKNTV